MSRDRLNSAGSPADPKTVAPSPGPSDSITHGNVDRADVDSDVDSDTAVDGDLDRDGGGTGVSTDDDDADEPDNDSADPRWLNTLARAIEDEPAQGMPGGDRADGAAVQPPARR